MLWPRTRLPPRNATALVLTAAWAVLVVGLLYVINRDCLDVVIASSQEKAALLKDIAAAYKRSDPRLDRRCVDVIVNEVKSGEAEDALARDWDHRYGPAPHVWSPAATSWVRLLRQHRDERGLANIVPLGNPSLMQSPLIIAMPEPMAVTLQKSIGAVGWKEILEITRDPAGWKSYGRAEWGAFQLGGTKPTSSTSGLHALIAIYSAAADMRELESSDVRRDDVRRLVCGVYSRVVHETDSVGDFLTSLLGADQRGDVLAYASAIAIEEKQVFEYNRGNPRSDYPAPPRKEPSVKLMALYPREGTLVADHPYVVLNASWVSDAAKAAASDFLRYLWTDPVQTHFRGAGFRDHEGQAGPEIAPPYFRKELVLERHAPEPAVLAELLRSWGGLRTCPVS